MPAKVAMIAESNKAAMSAECSNQKFNTQPFIGPDPKAHHR
jgi:hypothetical protein